MLRELRIKNFAIIDDLTVGFESGLNVLTGETGAGKSIIVDALSLALGSRAQSDSIRAGEKEAVVELKELAFSNAEFKIDIRQEAITYHGLDKVEFLFSANPGEPPKPLTKIASGGELSRIMLALKGILADVDNIPILIFDEVDAGIGGKTAEGVGKKLKRVSNKHQVLCTTHLPQIASMGDFHLKIE
ncbi:MAG: AAA family ATPase, partial [Nitrospirota bacterium]